MSTINRVLPDLSQASHAELLTLVSQMQHKLHKAATSKLRLAVSSKGAVSLYGIHSRFPVTLYAQQWAKLLAMGEDITQFCEDNKDSLSFKD